MDLVAIGASLGGVPVLATLLAMLPVSFPVPICVVQHLSATGPPLLAKLLAPTSRLPIGWAQEGDQVQPGQVYLAPADRHLLITREGYLHLSQEEHVEFVRPSVTRLLESVAAVYGARSLAIILTGRGCDGVRGIQVVKARGGFIFVQDPATARAPEMPRAAIATGCVDRILPVPALAAAILALVA